MPEITPSSYRIASARYARRSRSNRGQVLVVALAVLFILLFIGGIFVYNVAHNLSDSARGRDTQDAGALAEAGIKYCDNELSGSLDGADWRPQPSAPIGPNNGQNDPDYFWLQKGFTRLPLTGGRALIRVSYDPDPANPVGQAIKIESIGRTGELNPTDPTVFVQNLPSPRLRRELIAYKRIGIEDYLRYITDKDKRNGENYLGVPSIGHFFPMVFGNPLIADSSTGGKGVSGSETLYGGPVYCNSNLSIIGDAYFYEGPRGADPSGQIESLQVVGNLTANQFTDPSLPATGNYSSNTATRFNMNKPARQAWMNVDISQDPNSFTAPANLPGGPITPTLDQNQTTANYGQNNAFNTYGNAQRDGSPLAAANGGTRSVSRLNPPTIDTNVAGTGSLRVRQLTMQSGFWQNSTYNTGMHGWGTSVYVDNTTDLQAETLTPGITGSYSLPADWTNPNAGFSQSAWQGPYYRPPGLLVELLGDRMRLTRSDGKSFYRSDGTQQNNQNNGSTLEIPFSDIERSQLPTASGQPSVPPFPHDGDEPVKNGTTDPRSYGDANTNAKISVDPHSYGVNIVLFAEGNIRVKGVYGTITNTSATPSGGANGFLSRVHLTMITGGTAYIEGNLVKGDGKVAGTGADTILQRNSTCQVIAKDYVCVNTSMFMQPQNQSSVWNRISPDLDAFAAEIGLTRSTYDSSFSNGVSPDTYGVNQMLFLRHAALNPGPTAINMLINPAQDGLDINGNYNVANSGNTQYLWTNPYPGGGSTSPTYLLGIRAFPSQVGNGAGTIGPDLNAITPLFEQKAFPLDNTATTNAAKSYIYYPGYDNLFRFQIDQSPKLGSTDISLTSLQDYLLSAIMVAPLDIRIEAALYAQDKSFFIIPGYSFNPDQNDTRSHFNVSGTRTSFNNNNLGTTPIDQLDTNAKHRFPYANEPLDVRITLCGAIAENYTASVGAQAAWLQKWGYLPAKYGSFNAANPTQSEVPDDHLKARAAGIQTTGVELPLGYVPGQTAKDLRSPIESLNDAAPHANDFMLTRALLFEYDPALAMPYFHSTDVGLTGQPSRNTRLARALRCTVRTVTYGKDANGNALTWTFRQTLPPLPRLPIGPDLIYSGASDALIGENQYDTDFYTAP